MTWKGSREYLLAQVIRLVERHIESHKLRVDPPLFNQEDWRRRLIIALTWRALVEILARQGRAERAKNEELKC